MSNKRYPEEFKIEAVKQVTVAGHSVADVAECSGQLIPDTVLSFSSAA